MKKFLSVKDVNNVMEIAQEAIDLKSNPFAFQTLGQNKTLCMIFLNASLRTRLSTQKAARNLGMEVIVMNMGSEGWQLETVEGTVMDKGTAEHVKEAAAVIGQYCDVLAIRSFPGLVDQEDDYSEKMITSMVTHSGVPVVSLESSTLHPLQSLTDVITIEELKQTKKPKVVLTWAPHVKALPQAVPNSFAQWINATDYDFVITHPEGYDLDQQFVGKADVVYDQDEALRGADFVYAKNWSSFNQYGKILTHDPSWMISSDKMALTNEAKFMHCLPVRRNVVVSDDVIDSGNSVVIQQAGNRVFAAQAVLKRILENVAHG